MLIIVIAYIIFKNYIKLDINHKEHNVMFERKRIQCTIKNEFEYIDILQCFGWKLESRQEVYYSEQKKLYRHLFREQELQVNKIHRFVYGMRYICKNPAVV